MKLPQATASARPNYEDNAAAQSVVMAAMGQAPESSVEDEADSDTDATEATAGDVENSDEPTEETEETTDGSTESDDEESDEPVEAKAEEADTESPFTKADRAAINADPKLAKLAKGLQSSYTKRMQELGEVERFKKVLDGNPKEVLQRIAAANGLKVNFGDQAATPAVPDVTNADPVKAVMAKVSERWLPIIGEGATKEILEGIRDVVAATTGVAVTPLSQALAERDQQAQVSRATEEFDRFGKEFPDWKAHEPRMMEMAEQVNPNLGVYAKAKLLYELATRDTQIAKARTDGATKIAAKVKKAAAIAEPAPHTRVPGTKVKAAPPKYATSHDAAAAALAELGYS